MPPKTRSTDSGPGKTVPALVNNNYFSEYYLAYRLDAGLEELYKRWDAAEKDGTPTARTRVRSLTTALDKYRLDAALTAPGAVLAVSAGDDPNPLDGPLNLPALPADGTAAQRDLNDAVLAALGWTPARDTPLELISGDRSFTVPLAARCDTPAGTVVVALETVFGTDPATIVASKQAAAGTLLDPVRSGDRIEGRTALEAVQVIFTADAPPNYVLVVSGGSITLLDRDRWGEGVYLAANIDDALARHDAKPRGELAAIAALFSIDVINPGNDAQSYLASLLDKAANESAGVSKDLRHGVRRSVELLANAVVQDVRERQHGAWRSIDPKDLTRQCLRYLYRIIVLLFAEARPELGILPVDDPDYQSGYSLARLRDVALNELHTDHGKNATHLAESLALLFRLVNDGYEPESTLAAAEDSRGLRFRPLRSELFSETACPLLDRARIPDGVLRDVLEHLCFSREKSGKQRQALSYATLGINQLGAVYEGLMAYSGFLATEPLYEVDKDGDADNGSWVIPVTRADEFPDDVFLREEVPGGEPRRVRYESGDFVFRLSGRDRQRSASYYTPEVLTEFTVRHALEAFFAEHSNLRAVEILGLRICEPALGSGAFANEAINQLAARYLKAAQDEAGTSIDPERYQFELQKAKAHFAINQTFGVDLNLTAVELAEVSLWLNCMHAGLEAPWFGARLRKGNSLIGSRRATYTIDQVKNTAWTGKSLVSPTDQPLHEVPLGEATGIHHFLLPGEGWGAAADVKEIKDLCPEWVEAVKAWRKKIHRRPSQYQLDRLIAVAGRVEALWEQAATEVAQSWDATRHHIDVWGSVTPPPGSRYGEEAIRRVLYDHRSATCRLRRLMDAWCSLWMLTPQHGTDLPSLDEWLDGIEVVLGQPDPLSVGVLFLADNSIAQGDSSAKVESEAAWLEDCQAIAEREAWFHWELDFSPVFKAGGFDIQIGNPPWIRPTWDDIAALAEHEPLLGIADKIGPDELASRRATILANRDFRGLYLGDRAENAGRNNLLDSKAREPLLAGVQTNLYMNFMTNTWRRAHRSGSVGLIHLESHLVDPAAGALRAHTYHRLRRHWHFLNKTKLFSEIKDSKEYGVCIYGSPRTQISFLQASFLLHPSVADRSGLHDGSGELPAIQYPEGGWDLRPHRARLVTVDDPVLAEWVRLFDSPEIPSDESRLLKPLTTSDLGSLRVFAGQGTRIVDSRRYWGRGFDEDKLKREGTGKWQTHQPVSLAECIFQGPHILNGRLYGQQPRLDCRSNNDWEVLNLETLPEEAIPRTNFQRLLDVDQFLRRQPQWDGKPFSQRYRCSYREFVDRVADRTVKACLMPPGPAHIYTINSVALDDDRDTARLAGLMMALPYDYLVKTLGIGHLTQNFIDSLPMPGPHPALDKALLLRVLRLTALTAAYAPIWASIFDSGWKEDGFVAGVGSIVDLSAVESAWSAATPLRRDYDRWLAMCEVDAIVALLLGASADQLGQMYRSQFPVLRKYEYHMVFDGNGRQIARDHQAFGYQQAQWEAERKAGKADRVERATGLWDRVTRFLAGDGLVELGPFVPPFRAANREAAMTAAYLALCDRYGFRAT